MYCVIRTMYYYYYDVRQSKATLITIQNESYFFFNDFFSESLIVQHNVPSPEKCI